MQLPHDHLNDTVTHLVVKKWNEVRTTKQKIIHMFAQVVKI